MNIATTEPPETRAGDSWAWRREDLSLDYPATAWTLVYAFKNATLGFEITATADGDYFAVAVAGNTTAAYTAGTYAWQARVANIATPTTRYTVDEGTLVIQPSLFTTTAADPLDARTFARKMLDSVEAALLVVMAQKTSGAGIKSYTIGNRSMTYGDAESEIVSLTAQRDRWRLAVAREDQAEGRPNNLSRNSYVSFARA